MATSAPNAGLRDVVAGQSRICFVDGQEGRLVYQGYDIRELARHSSFEETVYLLWNGQLPNATALADFKAELAGERQLPPGVLGIVRAMPRDATPMDVLRTAVSALGVWDPDRGDASAEANHRRAVRLVAQVPTIVATYHRLRQGLEPVGPDPGRSSAADFLRMLTGRDPDELEQHVVDVCLVLHADHELNASTFSARVTAGTLSDLYSCITSAVGTLKGPLHGGANEQVMRMLIEIGSTDQAAEWVRDALARKVKVPGFGHAVYRTEDPRATILRRFSRQLGERAGDLHWYEVSQVVEQTMQAERHLYPNVDFYSASTYYTLGIPLDLFTPIFAVSRIAGWTAHVLEQYANNKLIRPRAEYVGPTHLEYVPLAARD